MEALTPAERRGALVVVLLLALGAGHDLWHSLQPLPGAGASDPLVTAAPGTPDLREPHPAPGGAPASLTEAREAGAVDLNRASVAELDALPGIGPVLAARIVAHRERHGPFGSPEELLAVRGIGPRLLARLQGRIRVNGREARSTIAADSLRRRN